MGGLITAGATLLGASNLAYSRRYLHGEFMYGRMVLISAFMLAGFNLVVSAPGLEDALLGWSIIGFSSTFLIGGFNDRPTARGGAVVEASDEEGAREANDRPAEQRVLEAGRRDDEVEAREHEGGDEPHAAVHELAVQVAARVS